MKKLCIFLFLISTLNLIGKGTDMIEFRSGMNIGGKYNKIETTDFKSDRDPQGIGYEFAIELIHEPIPNLITGLGTGYQRSSEMRIEGGDKYGIIDTIPVYATIKYRFNEEGTYMPYLKLNLGASIPYTRSALKRTGVEAETGFYWAMGGGIEYKSFIFDLSYQWNRNKFDGDYDGEIEFSRVTFGVGYRLGI
jgi:opacity protein-like surface antigen